MTTPQPGHAGLRGLDVLLLASAPWYAPTKVNAHHVAERLARSNRVLYVETTGLRTISGARDMRKALQRLRATRLSATEISPTLQILRPVAIPLHRFGFVRTANAAVLKSHIAIAIKQLPGFAPSIVWCFNPLMGSVLDSYPEALGVYHCVDDYRSLPGADARAVDAAEAGLLTKVDLVLTTSQPLWEAKQSLHRNVALVENVADAHHFALPTTCPLEFVGLPRPIIGYMGNIAHQKLDIRLIEQIAMIRPDWQLVLIGPIGHGESATDVSGLARHPNVHLVGRRPYEALPAYVQAMDVGMLPFNRNSWTTHSLPLKFFEFLAAGRPVVSVPLPSLKSHSNWFLPAETANDFVIQIEQALRLPLRLAEDRRAYARLHSWEARWPQIADMVARCNREVTLRARRPPSQPLERHG